MNIELTKEDIATLLGLLEGQTAAMEDALDYDDTEMQELYDDFNSIHNKIASQAGLSIKRKMN